MCTWPRYFSDWCTPLGWTVRLAVAQANSTETDFQVALYSLRRRHQAASELQFKQARGVRSLSSFLLLDRTDLDTNKKWSGVDGLKWKGQEEHIRNW